MRYFDEDFHAFDKLFEGIPRDTCLLDLDETRIPCEDLIKILRHQSFDDHTIGDVFMGIGKCFYITGSLEHWQCFVMVRGRAETGKSTIINVIKSFFDPAQVSIMMSDCEKQFGPEVLLNAKEDDCKMIALMPEVKAKKFHWNPALIQQLVDGIDGCTIPRKNKKAVTLPRFKAPLFFTGNENPDVLDSDNAFVRRQLQIEFGVRVTNVDSTIPGKIRKRRDEFGARSSLTYLKRACLYGNSNVWQRGLLSDMTHAFREKVRLSTQPLRHFIMQAGKYEVATTSDGRVDLGVGVLEEEIRDSFNEWARATGVRAPPWTSSNYGYILEELGLERRNTVLSTGSGIEAGYFFLGIRPVELDLG